jgi:hypothetical protein
VLAWRPLLPLFEAVINSFQAIKEAKLPANIPGRITIEVFRRTDQLDLDIPPISGFRVTDNGIGLDDDNWDSFNTAFSPHKLTRGGKGLGRFTWLKAFSHVKIDSTFKDHDGLHTRSFTFDENYDEDERGLPQKAKQSHTGTTVELVDLKRQYIHQCPKTTEAFIQKLIEHFILIFLEEDRPIVTVIDLGQQHNVIGIFDRDYKASASAHAFEINGSQFTLHGFRLPSSRTTRHKLLYAADQRSVLSDKLGEYLPNLATRLEGDDGKAFFYIGVIQSPYLSAHVNTNRTDFDFGDV